MTDKGAASNSPAYKFDETPQTHLTPCAKNAIQKIKQTEYAVLVGRNNSGKSFLLKSIAESLGETASYIGPARYNNFNVLGYFTPNRNRKRERWNQFLQHWRHKTQNIDNSPLNLQQSIAELSDDKRRQLFEIMNLLLGTAVSVEHTVANNTMSQKYLNCDGHNLSYTSSGFRLIATLITVLLDDDYSTFLIDEPELGISPEAQGVLSDFLFDRVSREKYFPHVKSLILATHSTIFLDRRCISNNFSITKSAAEINIEQVHELNDFNRIHFFLLGNRFETLYLPSAIILVEGPSDRKFLSRVLELEFPSSQFSVIESVSDGRMKEIVHLAGSIFFDLQKSPYRDRIFPVLDSRHERSVSHAFEKKGVPAGNIVVWSRNGIEFSYPDRVIDEIFGRGGDLTIVDDVVSRNGVSYRKVELADMVVSKLRPSEEYSREFTDKFLSRVQSVVAPLA